MMGSPQQKADRIRDNQRRSRERKKQRIEELEARVREFEKLGADATRAMQVAARRVDEDNRKLRAENAKLRAMLKKQGFFIEDGAIDAFLGVEPEPPLMAPHGMTTTTTTTTTTPAVQALQTMFNTRRFPDTPNMVMSPVDEPMPTSPPGGWASHHVRRNLSQDYTASATYALHGLTGGPQSPGGYDTVANTAFSATGLNGGGWGPSGSGSGSDGAHHLSSSSSGSAGQMSRASHDEFDDEGGDGSMMMDGRNYGVVHPDARYGAWRRH